MREIRTTEVKGDKTGTVKCEANQPAFAGDEDRFRLYIVMNMKPKSMMIKANCREVFVRIKNQYQLILN